MPKIKFKTVDNINYELEYIESGAYNNIANSICQLSNADQLKNIYEFNVSSATDFTMTFNNCTKLVTITDNFNTENGINFTKIFYNCQYLENIPTGFTCSSSGEYGSLNNTFITSGVTSLSSTFENCYKLDYIPQLDCQNVENADLAFTNCSTITLIVLNNLQKCQTMASTFMNCYNATIIDLNNNNLINCTNFSHTFDTCSSLIEIKDMNITNCNNFNHMFYNCMSLTGIPNQMFERFKTKPSTINKDNCFTGCTTMKTTAPEQYNWFKENSWLIE